jgi:hypothetical protein
MRIRISSETASTPGRPLDALARASGHLGEPGRDGIDDRLIAEDAPRLAARSRSSRRRSQPGRRASRDVPVRLLADQGQVDEVHEHPLKLAGNSPFVAAEWNMELLCGQ